MMIMLNYTSELEEYLFLASVSPHLLCCSFMIQRVSLGFECVKSRTIITAVDD